MSKYSELADRLPCTTQIAIAGTRPCGRCDCCLAAAALRELERHLSAICEMQQRNYGHGFNTHIELSDLAADARQALAGKQPQEGE